MRSSTVRSLSTSVAPSTSFRNVNFAVRRSAFGNGPRFRPAARLATGEPITISSLQFDVSLTKTSFGGEEKRELLRPKGPKAPPARFLLRKEFLHQVGSRAYQSPDKYAEQFNLTCLKKRLFNVDKLRPCTP